MVDFTNFVYNYVNFQLTQQGRVATRLHAYLCIRCNDSVGIPHLVFIVSTNLYPPSFDCLAPMSGANITMCRKWSYDKHMRICLAIIIEKNL